MISRAERFQASVLSQLKAACSIPILKPIHAVFTPMATGQSCSPPACQTVYTEEATKAEYGGDLTYSWSVSIPADAECAKGFQPNVPAENQATWYHADTSQGGTCNHSGSDYDSSGSGHPGMVTVIVTNDYWSCTATYYGTQGPQGQPTGDGPPPQRCEANKY